MLKRTIESSLKKPHKRNNHALMNCIQLQKGIHPQQSIYLMTQFL